jgi:hypothetical protein
MAAPLPTRQIMIKCGDEFEALLDNLHSGEGAESSEVGAVGAENLNSRGSDKASMGWQSLQKGFLLPLHRQ